ncbi:MAG: threonine--tRNA ligase [Patescibacteria group bacterium]
MSKVNKPENKMEPVRHSLAHLMIMAVLELYPQAGLGVGPSIDDGFYQDFDIPQAITPELLPKLEKRMRELIKKNIKFEQHDVDFKEAYEFYKNDPYKTWFIDDLKARGEKKVSFYKSDWLDNLCAGPHVKSTKEINPDGFKLTKIAGAYWRGDEKNKMLQRIYGTAFATEAELKKHLELLEEAKRRDHRVIGKDLDLFVFSDLVGKGLPLFTEKGSIIRRELERFIVDEEIKRDYKHVYTPELAKVELYKKSGHYPYYKDTMYPVMKIDEEELILRPMTCPHHFQLYLSKPHTYKELPIRIAELAKQFRYEKSGELTGLMRVRSFCLADSHIVCRPDQATSEINNVLDLIEYVASVMGLTKGENFRYRLSLGDRQEEKKYYKDDKAWDDAEDILRQVLKKRQAPFFEAEGEAAFYGPKIDIQMKNFAGKEDTAFTVQYDFVMPKRFELVYIDEDNKKKEAVVIHRSSIGAIERVMAFLIEQHAGAFPLWLSPVQVQIAPVAATFVQAAKEIAQELITNNVRVYVDEADETVGYKVRKSEKAKVPYTLVIGEKEAGGADLAVRVRGQKEMLVISRNEFIEKMVKEIKEKK